MVQRLSNEVLETLRSDKAIRAGNIDRIIRPGGQGDHAACEFRRMMAAAVGPAWRKATPEQQQRLQDEFKILLVRTYAGALTQVTDQTVRVKPLRAAPEDKDVLVRTEIIGHADPIQLDYRLEKTPTGWRIYNLNVLGVWMVETYRTQFAQEINARGIDGLIEALAARNKSNEAAAKS